MKTILKTLFFSCFITICSAQYTDIDWLKKVHTNRNTNLDKGFYYLSQSTYPVSLAVPATEWIMAFKTREKAMRAKAIHSSIALVGAVGTTYILKRVIDKPRPYQTHFYIQNYYLDDNYSFPSGHSTAAFATATTLTLHYPKWYVAVPAYAYAGTIGYTRMHLGMHYPSDVAMGAGIGIASAFVSYKLQQWIINR